MLRARARHRLRGARPGRSSAAEQEEAQREKQKAAVAAAMSARPRARKRRRNQATRGGGGRGAGTGIAAGDQGRAERRDGRCDRDVEPQGTAGAAQTMHLTRALAAAFGSLSCYSRHDLDWADTELHGQAVIPSCFLRGKASWNGLQFAYWCLLSRSMADFIVKKPSVQSGTRKQTKIHRQCACWVLMACPF